MQHKRIEWPQSSIPDWSDVDFSTWLKSLQYLDQDHLVRRLSGFFNGRPPNEWVRIALRAYWPAIERPAIKETPILEKTAGFAKHET